MSDPKPPQRQPKRPITDAERIAITKEKFRTFASNQVLARKFRRHPSQISEAVHHAFAAGLVEVRAVAEARIRLDDELQDRLRAEHPELQEVLVVDPGEAGKRTDAAAAGADDDHVHAMLGEALGRFLLSYFRPGDRLGLGSGRGVFQTVESLRSRTRHPIRVGRIDLVSLTGGAHVLHHHAPKTVLDADHIVARLGECFAGQISMHLIARSIAYGDADLLRRDIERTVLAAGRWATLRPTHALVGVGVLAEGHRFYDAVRHRAETEHAATRQVEEIHNLLETLVSESERLQAALAPGYVPVADICNRLFLVAPRGRRRGAEVGAMLADLDRTIDAVNARLLTIRKEQLYDIDTILLVAGTRPKAAAIRHFLNDRELRIRILCTDSACARAILR